MALFRPIGISSCCCQWFRVGPSAYAAATVNGFAWADALHRYMAKFAIGHFYLKIRIMSAMPAIISITDMTQVHLSFRSFRQHLLGVISHKHCCSIAHLFHHAI